MEERCGPRCTVAMWNNSAAPTDGSALLFTVNSSLQLASWVVDGVLNPTPTDGLAEPIQSGYSTKFQDWYDASFSYNGSQGGCGSSGVTAMCDSDGHATMWSTNNRGEVNQTQDWTGAAEALWITTGQTWDSMNNLTSTTDANGYTTQYGYDQVGNAVEVEQPGLTDIYNASGSYNPVSCSLRQLGTCFRTVIRSIIRSKGTAGQTARMTASAQRMEPPEPHRFSLTRRLVSRSVACSRCKSR